MLNWKSVPDKLVMTLIMGCTGPSKNIYHQLHQQYDLEITMEGFIFSVIQSDDRELDNIVYKIINFSYQYLDGI